MTRGIVVKQYFFIQNYTNTYRRISGIALNQVGFDDVNIKDGVKYSDFIGERLKPDAYLTTTTAPINISLPNQKTNKNRTCK